MGVTRREEEVGFEVFPERQQTGERAVKDLGIVTEGIREVFD